MKFRAKGFDPILILCQIITIQSSFTVVHSLTLILFSYFSKIDLTLKSLYTLPSFKSFLILLTASTLQSFVASRIIERSRKVLDFTLTMFFLYFLASVWNGVSIYWFVGVGCCVACSVILTEYLCMQKELEPIILSAHRGLV